MKAHVLGAVCCVFLLASAVGMRAQTAISGAVQCDKPVAVASVDVGDMPGHSMSLNKGTCTWTKPMMIAGAKTQTDALVFFVEMTATKSVSTGSVVGTLDSGDQMFVSIHDSEPVKDGVPGNGNGTFTFTGGTGKLAGLKGHGTYTMVMNADGTSTSTVHGTYMLSGMKPAPPSTPAVKTN